MIRQPAYNKFRSQTKLLLPGISGIRGVGNADEFNEQQKVW